MSENPETGPAIITIRGLGKRYGDFQALRDVDMDINKSEVTCLIGPSGSGKSTLLRCLNFLEAYEDCAPWPRDSRALVRPRASNSNPARSARERCESRPNAAGFRTRRTPRPPTDDASSCRWRCCVQPAASPSLTR